MKLFAHRGVMAHYPENTMAAFRAAIVAGADGIETDVHMTRDGVLVLIHDESLERTTDGRGRVVDLTLAELRTANAAVHFEGSEPVPTLEEFLALVMPTGLCVNLELKTDIEHYPGIEERLVEVVERTDFPANRLVISSFNHDTLRRLRKLSTEYELAALSSRRIADPVAYLKQLDASAFHPSVRASTDAEIATLVEAGVKVRPYTVKTLDQLTRFQKLGVDALFVNDIEWARTHLAL
ncbi:glycerophosphodiester phosphodiesterase [Exiguobacterium sp.]|uniref:glycerophosphodiester phosphodiesterase n=1 Tax=Exiguobacterium sp. TaxID=44751 RepID=UPI00263BE590|nr:glycerophosphodiester phosphodiesterase [Exiguobacterium sp.]MCC5892106.1 glycerophosphodiester phosphodiesterase [Exiguobacterium sp.]